MMKLSLLLVTFAVVGMAYRDVGDMLFLLDEAGCGVTPASTVSEGENEHTGSGLTATGSQNWTIEVTSKLRSRSYTSILRGEPYRVILSSNGIGPAVKGFVITVYDFSNNANGQLLNVLIRDNNASGTVGLFESSDKSESCFYHHIPKGWTNITYTEIAGQLRVRPWAAQQHRNVSRINICATLVVSMTAPFIHFCQNISLFDVCDNYDCPTIGCNPVGCIPVAGDDFNCLSLTTCTDVPEQIKRGLDTYASTPQHG